LIQIYNKKPADFYLDSNYGMFASSLYLAMKPTNDEMKSNKPTILLVEDDVRLARLIKEYMEQHSFIVNIEGRGDTALERIKTEQPALVILDLMLPGLDGMDVCRQVRPHFENPILMLTARDEDIDQVLGLEFGADDYVIKPVKPRVLLARIQNLLRRFKTKPDDKVSFSIGELYISSNTRDASLKGNPLYLKSQEFELLYLLTTNVGKILSRDDILTALSGIEYDGLNRSVDIRIARLRKILMDDPANPQYIKTVRSQGYLFLS
jgi:two-component system, OmpR family, response regulator RstA